MDEYLGELSLFREVAVGAMKAAEYPYLEDYWSDPDRFPLTVWSNQEIVGFALVRRLRGREPPVMQVAEFFVKRDHRRRGIGRAAAVAIWDQFPGPWELQVLKGNHAAAAFWKECINARAAAWQVDEIHADDGRRLFFRFHVGPG